MEVSLTAGRGVQQERGPGESDISSRQKQNVELDYFHISENVTVVKTNQDCVVEFYLDYVQFE